MKQACFASRNVNPLRKKRHTQVDLLTEPVRMNMPFYLRIDCGHYIEGLFCEMQDSNTDTSDAIKQAALPLY